MTDILEQDHTLTLYNSLDKIYNKARLEGKLYPQDLYILNIIYKLLGCNFTLNRKQKQCLLDTYNNILLNSNNICPNITPSIYQTTPIQTFTQADVSDNNDYPLFGKIIYWQEGNYLITDSDIISQLIGDTNFLEGKLSDIYPIFEVGKLISYTSIGRICFLGLDSGNDIFEIYDILNNNVTDTFDITFINELNSTLIVSKNIYSHGDMFFKIKKITT